MGHTFLISACKQEKPCKYRADEQRHKEGVRRGEETMTEETTLWGRVPGSWKGL